MPYITVDEGKGTKIDLEGYKDLIRILEGVFRDPNKKVTAQKTLIDTLREYLDIFCMAYLDDILIYSEILKKHR